MNYTASDLRITKKYALAFFKVFGHHIHYTDSAKIEAAQKLLSLRRNILFFLQLPHLDVTTKSSLIEDLVDYLALPTVFLHLFMVLVKDNRIFYSSRILFFIVQLYKQSHNIQCFTITTAHEISTHQKERIKYFLNTLTGSSIMCSYAINRSLIAGIRMQSFEYLWEYSVRKQLACLRSLAK